MVPSQSGQKRSGPTQASSDREPSATRSGRIGSGRWWAAECNLYDLAQLRWQPRNTLERFALGRRIHLLLACPAEGVDILEDRQRCLPLGCVEPLAVTRDRIVFGNPTCERDVRISDSPEDGESLLVHCCDFRWRVEPLDLLEKILSDVEAIIPVSKSCLHAGLLGLPGGVSLDESGFHR